MKAKTEKRPRPRQNKEYNKQNSKEKNIQKTNVFKKHCLYFQRK